MYTTTDLPKTAAGFPSPASDFKEHRLDLNDHLIKNPAATYFMRVGAEIDNDKLHSGDIVIIDRSLSADNGDLLVVVAEGEFKLRYFHRRNNRIYLSHPQDGSGSRTDTQADPENLIWGVVTYIIHSPQHG